MNPSDATRPLFSIVIPTKQEAGYIALLLRNVAEARPSLPFAIETVVVDGRSTDDTVEQAGELADRLVVDSEQACRTIASARNVGAHEASGDFLLHTDADVLFPDLSGLLHRVLLEFADPSVVGLTALVTPYPWEGTWRDRRIHRVSNAFFRSSRWYGSRFSRGECQIVRASTFEALGGYTTRFVSGEDCDLFRRAARKGRVVYLTDHEVHHSLRRFRHDGYLRTFGIYVREWLWMTLLDRSFVTEWRPVR